MCEDPEGLLLVVAVDIDHLYKVIVTRIKDMDNIPSLDREL